MVVSAVYSLFSEFFLFDFFFGRIRVFFFFVLSSKYVQADKQQTLRHTGRHTDTQTCTQTDR